MKREKRERAREREAFSFSLTTAHRGGEETERKRKGCREEERRL
jgi:hypothetical protein